MESFHLWSLQTTTHVFLLIISILALALAMGCVHSLSFFLFLSFFVLFFS